MLAGCVYLLEPENSGLSTGRFVGGALQVTGVGKYENVAILASFYHEAGNIDPRDYFAMILGRLAGIPILD